MIEPTDADFAEDAFGWPCAVEEMWVDIPGFKGGYAVSSEGRVLSRFISRCLRPGPHAGGYVSVSLCGKTHMLHSLVMAAFVGPRPDGMQVCHRNGVRDDNRLRNLRYDTALGNDADKDEHGTRARGEMYASAKLTEEAAIACRTFQGIFSQRDLAKMFGVARQTIQSVQQGRTWTHV